MEDTISALPRLTVVFNKAKRHASQSLMRLSHTLSNSHHLTTDAVRELRRILRENVTQSNSDITQLFGRFQKD
jgi:hypothetical protein